MRFVTCRLPDGVEDPAILSPDGTQIWPLSWLGLSYETLSDAIPFLTPQVRAGLQLAIAGIPALPAAFSCSLRARGLLAEHGLLQHGLQRCARPQGRSRTPSAG